jgi:prolycopene isomerase
MEMNYFLEGVYVARGGAQALTDVFVEALRRHGGELACRAEVRRIRREDNRVVAVRLADGREIATRRVVAAMLPTAVFGDMLTPPLPHRHPYRRRLASLQTSYSYLIGFWGVTTEDLGASTIGNKEIFDDYDLMREYAALARGEIDLGAPCFVLIPSIASRDAVPGGRGHTVCASVKAPYAIAGGWSTERRRELVDHLFERARGCLPLLERADVEVEESVTPIVIERFTGNRDGSPYGWAHRPGQIGLDRPGPTTPVQGLYLAGHWTRPGGGVASVIVSGHSLANRLLAGAGQTS